MPRNVTALVFIAVSLLVTRVVTADIPGFAAESDQEYAGTAKCRECHDFAPAEHVDRLLLGSHGISAEAGFTHGCEDCHGPSESHAAAPREVSPTVSFGPRWKTSGADRDRACLACHESGVAENWQHALHMHNELTCVICHDIHSEGDTVLLPEQQAGVCTTCHKAQQSGIHGLGGDLSREPPCSSCHNPHNHETAEPQMLANDSAGCRGCHDVETMLDDPLLPAKTRDYHLAAQKTGRTCLTCHRDIAHGSERTAPLRPDNFTTNGR